MEQRWPVRWTVVFRISRRGILLRGVLLLVVIASGCTLGMIRGRYVPSMLPVSLEEGWVSSEFGMRVHPITGEWKMHEGIDLAVDEGVLVKATACGKVIFAGESGGYGNLVKIDHRNGIETRYAHNSVLKVKKGDYVRRGQVIALAGHSGRATGDHLHYEVRIRGKPVNPRKYLGSFVEGGLDRRGGS
jgi:murein DD-endopeptidase MepM/ murein hydrolase activator NlpD